MKPTSLDLKVNVNTTDIEKALKRLEKAITAVSQTAVVIKVTHAAEKKWYQFWK